MQIFNKLIRLQNVYIFFTSFVLFIIIFSTTYLNANTFKVSDVEISSPFDLNFKKSLVIDEGFQSSFYNLLSMITTSGDKQKIKNIYTFCILKNLFIICINYTNEKRKFYL